MKIENPNPNIHVDIKISHEQNWNPLYILLKEIFGDKYKEAANGFMCMGKVTLWDGCELFDYKHGITRKSICITSTGTPMKLNYEYKWVEIDGKKSSVTFIYSVEEMSIVESYKKIYENIHQTFGVNKDAPELTSYSKEYIEKRTQTLKDAGYNVIEISTKDSPEQLRNKLNNLK